MEETGKYSQDRIRNALGSSRVVPLPGLPSQGPLDLLQLARELRRLQTQAKTPSVNLQDQKESPPPVQLSLERSREVFELATALSHQGAQVSPNQLADLLLSSALSQLKTLLRAITPGEKRPENESP